MPRTIFSTFLFLLGSALISWPWGNAARANDPGTAATPDQLVADALRAESTGETARRRVLLSVAIDAAPNYSPARWHSGQILVNGKWCAVDEAQEAAAADPQRNQYQVLREASGEGLEPQLVLARWCRKNGLGDECNTIGKVRWVTTRTTKRRCGRWDHAGSMGN